MGGLGVLLSILFDGLNHGDFFAMKRNSNDLRSTTTVLDDLGEFGLGLLKLPAARCGGSNWGRREDLILGFDFGIRNSLWLQSD